MSLIISQDQDLNGKKVHQTSYRGTIIGSILYLTSSRLDIMFSVCFCVRFPCNPKESHLITVKRILKYLRATKGFSLGYPSSSNIALVGYLDANP